jgi:4-amino-4-deoxy-L-arabinose transferase-like glycosyltransferase
MNSLVAIWLKASWRPLLVLVLALVVRLVYNLYFFEHRICHAGDSYYYLTGGKALARLISTSHNWGEFSVQLWQKASVLPGSFQSFSSEHLTDRLLLDGPVFPSYLGFLFLLLGQKASEVALNVNSTFFAAANSIVDSLSCLFLYFLTAEAFGSGAGLTAGLLLALYGPAVVNTQQCYSEPFAYFLLLAWCLVFTRLVLHSNRWPGAYFLFGVLTGLVMLSKPAFVVVPALGLAVFLLARCFTALQVTIPKSIWFPLGLALVLAPWLFFTASVSGKASLLVNRAPEYNLFIGNHLPSDGWKTWPTPDGVPQSMDEAKLRLAQQFMTSGEHSLSLIFRKIPRLFAGVWTEFQYEVVGLNLLSQNLVQGLLLLLGWLGLAALVGRSQREEAPRQFALAITFAAIAGYHLVYALFEPVPRYAITAIPLVMALGAGGLFTLFRAALKLGHEFFEYSALVVLALISGVGFYQLYNFYSFIPVLAQTMPDSDFLLLRGINCFIWLVFFTFIVFLAALALSLAGLNSRLSKTVLGAGALLMVACCLAFFNFDPAQAEWYQELGDGDFVQQTLNLPSTIAAAEQNFLLVDCQSNFAPPQLIVKLNGRELPAHPWLLWHELRPSDKDVHALLHFQGNSMATDFRLLRQWWAYPLGTGLKGGSNDIELIGRGSQRVKVYGDFLPGKRRSAGGRPAGADVSPGDIICLPSLDKFSWTKGFLSFDHRDPRTYETVNFGGYVEKCSRYNVKLSKLYDYDLSDSPGLQTGIYRIRVASLVESSGSSCSEASSQAFAQASANSADSEKSLPRVLFEHKEDFTVRGDDPRTMTLFSEQVENLPPGGLLQLSLQAHKDRVHARIPVEITLSLNATAADGRSLSWTSKWQPSSLAVGSDWSSVEYANFLPPDSDKWQHVTVKLLFAPFPADRLFLHKKQALKDRLDVREVQVSVLGTAAPAAGHWRYY